MTRRGAIASLVSGAATILAGCQGLFGTTARLRYRITITCETPDGFASGSAVQEIVNFDTADAFKPVNVGSTEMIGDAVVIVVGAKRYFAGLNQCSALLDDAIRIGDIQPPSARVDGGNAEVLAGFKQANARAVMDGHRYMSLPSRGFSLDTFRDEDDYATLESVDFGKDASSWKLKTVAVAVTNDPVTRQVIKLMPWLRTLSREDVKSNPKYNGYLNAWLANLSNEFGAGR